MPRQNQCAQCPPVKLDLLGPEHVAPKDHLLESAEKAPKDHVLESAELPCPKQARSLWVLVMLDLLWLRSSGL